MCDNEPVKELSALNGEWGVTVALPNGKVVHGNNIVGFDTILTTLLDLFFFFELRK